MHLTPSVEKRHKMLFSSVLPDIVVSENERLAGEAGDFARRSQQQRKSTMNALAVAVKPCWDVLAQTWDAISLAKDCLVTALRLLNEAKNIRELFRRRRPKKHRVAAHEVTARITFGAPTTTARVSVSPPVWL
jgi:hypothetical protein